MRTKILLTLSVISLFLAAPGFAQIGHVAKAKIDFPFMVGSKVLPAGEYTFESDSNEEGVFRVVGEAKGADALAEVESRIPEPARDASTNARIVFDKVGDSYILSEIWLPQTDGYLFHVTKTAHTHATVRPHA